MIYFDTYLSNTFKVEHDPGTHQMMGEKITIDPIEVKLNALGYGKVPEVPAAAD